MLEALKVESIDIAIAHLEKGFFESLPKFENTQSVAQKLESKTQISQIQTQTRELESQKEIPTLESAKKRQHRRF